MHARPCGALIDFFKKNCATKLEYNNQHISNPSLLELLLLQITTGDQLTIIFENNPDPKLIIDLSEKINNF